VCVQNVKLGCVQLLMEINMITVWVLKADVIAEEEGPAMGGATVLKVGDNFLTPHFLANGPGDKKYCLES